MTGIPLLKHTWTTNVKNDTGGAVLADTQTVFGSNEFNESIQIAAGATAEIDCGSLAYAKIVSLFVASTVAVTFDTNALGGAGGQTITLAANKAFAWNSSMPTTCPITVNITKIFVTNAGVTTASFKAGFLLNLLIA